MTYSKTGSELPIVVTRLASGLGVLLLAAAAGAEPASPQQDRVLAEALFRDGRALMEKRDYAAACPKLEESYRIDPASGTLLNLAVCHEGQGKLATAWAEYQSALGLARRQGRQKRVVFAEAALERLEPQVPKLVLHVNETPGAELTVELDGAKLGSAGWGSAMPVDPGTVVVVAEAPGFLPYRAEIAVAVGQKLTLQIPRLEHAPSGQEGSPTQAPVSQQAAVVGDSEPSGTSSRRVGAYVAGGLGLVSLGAGAFFGLRAADLQSESDEHCSTDGTCSKRGLELYESAQSSATLSTLGVGLGLVGLGVAGYLLITDEGTSPASATEVSAQRAWGLAPQMGDETWGLSAWGGF